MHHKQPIRLKGVISLDRIDALIAEFDREVRETKRLLQDRGFGRRCFLENFKDSNDAKDLETKDSSGRIRGLLPVRSDELKDVLRNHEVSEFNYSRSIVSFGLAYQWREAEEIFKVCLAKFPNSSDICSAMMYAYGKSGEFERAESLFSRVLANQPTFHITLKMFGSLLEAYAVHIERMIIDAQSTAVGKYERGILLRASIDPAMQIYKQLLDDFRFVPNISIISTLVKLAGRLKRPDILEEMMKEIERFELTLDTQCLEVFFFSWLQCEKFEEAELMLERAIDGGIFCFTSPDAPRILSTMLFGYCRLKRPVEAKAILSRFLEHGIQPHPSAAAFLVGTFAKSGLLADAEHYFAELRSESNISDPLLVGAANNLLQEYARVNNAPAFFDLIDELGLKRDRYTTSMLFDFLGKNPNLSRLKKELYIFRSKLTSTASHMELTALFRCLFSIFGSDDLIIRELLATLQNSNDTSNKYSSHSLDDQRALDLILLETFSKLADWEKCTEIVNKLLSNSSSGSSSNQSQYPAIFSMLISAASHFSDRVEFVFEWMRRVNCWRDPMILVAAMSTYCQQAVAEGHFGKIQSLWQEVSQKRMRARTYSSAIAIMAEALFQNEGPEAALQHLNRHPSFWNDAALQIYLKSWRLGSSISLSALDEFFDEIVTKTSPLPSISVCNEVLESLGMIDGGGRLESMKKIVDWMIANGRHANIHTVNVLLKSSPEEEGSTKMNWLKAEELLKLTQKLIDASISSGHEPSKKILLRVISDSLKLSNEPGDEWHVRAEMYSNLFLISPVPSFNDMPWADRINQLTRMFEAWLFYYKRHGRMDCVQRLLLQMKRLDIKP